MKNLYQQLNNYRYKAVFCLLLGALVFLTGSSAVSNKQKGRAEILVDDFESGNASSLKTKWHQIDKSGKLHPLGGQVEYLTYEGRRCLHIKHWNIPHDNKSLVLHLPLGINRQGINAFALTGLKLMVKAAPGRYEVRLQNASTWGAKQYFRSQWTGHNQWQEIRLPFKEFKPVHINKPFYLSVLRNISITKVDPDTQGQLYIEKILFYKGRDMFKELTPDEKKIIVHKGTEPPFSGKYHNFFAQGIYACKRCGAALFHGQAKFPSQCGWPSFDDQIGDAVKMIPDADGVRTEIVCNECQGHLGHIFLGEGYTPKNTRYCVNSLSLDFIPDKQKVTEKAIFAGGCFWGVEYYFKTAPGVISTSVGYTGGHKQKPTYKQVCTSRTGHAEAIEVIFDPNKTSYETLVKLFFEIHDFTQLNRQGPDIGSQYRSAIFYQSNQQKQIAQDIVQYLEKKGFNVKTTITAADTFWSAESYHQDYYGKNGKQPYCHIRKKIF